MERRGERSPSFPFLLVGFYWDWHGWLLYNNGMASSKRTDGRKTVCGLVAGNTRSRRLSSACTDGTDDSTAADRGLQPLPSSSYPARRRAESCPTHTTPTRFACFSFLLRASIVSRVRALFLFFHARREARTACVVACAAYSPFVLCRHVAWQHYAWKVGRFAKMVDDERYSALARSARVHFRAGFATRVMWIYGAF